MASKRLDKRTRRTLREPLNRQRKTVYSNVGLGSGPFIPAPTRADRVSITNCGTFKGKTHAFSDPVGNVFKGRTIDTRSQDVLLRLQDRDLRDAEKRALVFEAQLTMYRKYKALVD